MPSEINNIFFWFLILIFLDYLLNHLWSRLFLGRSYQFFITPGIIIHEISHALACLLTFAKIKRIVFFAKEGGYVEHQKPKLPLGNLIISFAPIFGIVFSLFILVYYFGYKNFLELDYSLDFQTNSINLLKNILIFFETNWREAKFWLFIYLVLSLVTSLAPSRTDLKQAFGGALFFLVITFLIIHYHQNIIPSIGSFINNYLGWVFSLGVFMELLALFITLPFWLIKKVINYYRV